MKVHFCLTMMAPDGVKAACHFEADVNWLALDMRDVDKMKNFRAGALCDLMMAFPDGSSFRYVPLGPPPMGAVEWLRDVLGLEPR